MESYLWHYIFGSEKMLVLILLELRAKNTRFRLATVEDEPEHQETQMYLHLQFAHSSIQSMGRHYFRDL